MVNVQMGPDVRIGVLQNVRSVQFRLMGSYSIDGKEFGAYSGVWTASVEAACPAKLSYSLVLKKCFSMKDAEAFIQSEPGKNLRILTVGEDYCYGSDKVTSKEFWVCEGAFDSRENADKQRLSYENFPYIDIVAEVAQPASGKIVLENEAGDKLSFDDQAFFQSSDNTADRVILENVLVGISFHWEHFENQRYRRNLDLIIDNKGLLTAVNELPLEEYLFSVNSSEMKADCPMELLKAQTIAARNTLLATKDKHHHEDAFDICQDDHCQCYRGSSREREASIQAVVETFGQVLSHNGQVCDCRYSKICGGYMEDFDSVWYDDPRDYMVAGLDIDKDRQQEVNQTYPANTEDKARAFLENPGDVFCNTLSRKIPKTIEYAKEYFRWTFEYEANELSDLIKKRVGKFAGTVQEMIPLKRGRSGRIELLKVICSDGEFFLGKELEIRFALHEKCLYSSFFVVDAFEKDGKSWFKITGGGWGHGVGMCQIGATVMAAEGYDYDQILYHYFKETKLDELYAPKQRDYVNDFYANQDRKGEKCFEYRNCYEINMCSEQYHFTGEKWEKLDRICGENRTEPTENATQIIAQCPFHQQCNK